MASHREKIEELISSMNRFGNELGAAYRSGRIKDNKQMAETEEMVDALQQYMVTALMNGSYIVNKRYEDPDLSPLTGVSKEGMKEKCIWASGMDYLPHVPFPNHLSDWLLNIYLGNYSKFMKQVESMSKEALERQMKMRETILQLSAIFHVIIGARQLFPGSPLVQETIAVRGRFEGEHMKILKKLLELGVNVNVHDVAGYTPLHHCLTSQGNAATFDMAKLLLLHGANPNAVNRFGNPPLSECIMVSNVEGVKLLMENKADPHIKDNDGVSPYDMGIHIPAMVSLLGIKDRRDIRLEQKRNEKLNPDYKKCGVCLKPSTKKCSGCQLEFYCSVDHQKEDWNAHKSICKERRDKYLPVEILQRPGTTANYSYKTGKVEVVQHKKTKKTHFVLKIQVPLVGDDDGMLVYDKSKSVNGLISAGTPNGAILRDVVKTKGFRGMKGFFNAVNEDGQISVSPEILLPESW